ALAYPDAGASAEVVLNATHGAVSLQALEAVGAANLSGKVIVDVALPLDMSEGMPPTLTVANTDSLGEQIQRAYPDAHVVKTLNTVFCEVMVDPSKIPGDHNIFLASDHEDAKAVALDILHQFGWSDDVIIDLGGIKRARSSEMYMPLYFTLAGLEGTFEVNISVKRAVAWG
ncbi:NADPH-dependent F420 reductase, partial [Kocuria subflava]